MLQQLRHACLNEVGEEDTQRKGTQLLEIYALEIQVVGCTSAIIASTFVGENWMNNDDDSIQIHIEQGNNAALKALYERSIHVMKGAASPHPSIMGLISGRRAFHSSKYL